MSESSCHIIVIMLSLIGTMYANGGIPLKYAPDGSVAIVSEPRQTQIFDGKEYVMEYALRPDVSLVKAFKADTRGNLIFRGTSQNANPDCAVAGKVVVVSDWSVLGPCDCVIPLIDKCLTHKLSICTSFHL